MAKKTTDTIEKEVVESRFPIDPEEMPIVVLADKPPTGLKVDQKRQKIILTFKEQIKNDKNYLNEYTKLLRAEFAKASMPNWNIHFHVNGRVYYSTL